MGRIRSSLLAPPLNITDTVEFQRLAEHAGHRVEVATYGSGLETLNVAVECLDCSTVIVDEDRYPVRVTSLVDAELTNLYDEIMAADPLQRTAAEEAFIEYVAERLVAEVADQDVFVNDDGVIPRCDICNGPQLRVGDDWNGDTGNHRSCEEREPLFLGRDTPSPELGAGGME